MASAPDTIGNEPDSASRHDDDRSQKLTASGALKNTRREHAIKGTETSTAAGTVLQRAFGFDKSFNSIVEGVGKLSLGHNLTPVSFSCVDESWPKLKETQERVPPKQNTNQQKNDTIAAKVQPPLKKKPQSCSVWGNNRGAISSCQSKEQSSQTVEDVFPLEGTPESGITQLSVSSDAPSNMKVYYQKSDCTKTNGDVVKHSNDKKNVERSRLSREVGKSTTLKMPHRDSRIQIIDADAIRVVTPSLKNRPKNDLLLGESDFPALSCAGSSPSKSFKNQGLMRETDLLYQPETISSRLRKSSGTKTKERKKQPKRKDPISINILDILEDNSLSQQKSQTQSLGKKLKPFRIEEPRRPCGNMLDSSNPVRKRGKHREFPPKKRLSKLKCVIMNERQKKYEKLEKILSALSCRVLNRANINHKLSLPATESEGGVSFLQLKTLDDPDYVQKHPSEIENMSQEDLKEANKPSASNDDNKNDTKLTPNKNRNHTVLHSRKFREYCENSRNRELDDATLALLKELYRFQDRLHQRDPIKAHAKRRFVLGIREVKKFLFLKKLKIVIVAPDLEPVNAPGGLDEAIKEIKDEGNSQEIPVVFAAGRRKLGYAIMKKVPISVIGIINYEGAEKLHQQMIKEWEAAADDYKQRTMCVTSADATSQDQDSAVQEEKEENDINKEVVQTLLAKLKEPIL